MTGSSSDTPRPQGAGPSLADQAARLADHPIIPAPRRRFGQGWSARHLIAMTLFAPVLVWAFRSAAQYPSWQDVPWTVAVLALAALGTLVATSYVPVRGTTRRGAPSAGASPCASVAGVHVVAAAMLLSIIPALPMAGLALAIEVFALYQRTGNTCGAA